MLSFLLLSGRHGGKTAMKMGLEIGSLKTVKIPLVDLQSQLADLKKQSYVVWPNFLVDADLVELKDDLDSRFDAGLLADAAVKGAVRDIPYEAVQARSVLPAVRKTATVWLDNFHPKTSIESKLLMYLDVFRMQLCEELEVDLNFLDTEVLYARYPVGGYYKAHSDSHLPAAGVQERDTERYLSFILYINEDRWLPEHGGCLKMYGNEHDLWKEADFVTIDPTPGTLVMFFSRGLRHEVLATRVIRRAVVGWFRIRSRSGY